MGIPGTSSFWSGLKSQIQFHKIKNKGVQSQNHIESISFVESQRLKCLFQQQLQILSAKIPGTRIHSKQFSSKKKFGTAYLIRGTSNRVFYAARTQA